MSEQHTFSLGTAVEEAFAAATYDWCAHNRGTMSREEAFAKIVSSVLVQVLYGFGGQVNVTVTVGGRRFNDDEAYFFRFQRGANSTLTFTGGSINL